MNKPVGAALLVMGLCLLIVGYNVSSNMASPLGTVPGTHGVWFLVGGGLLAAIGFHFIMMRK